MSEKTDRKAIELDDAELDRVAGGKALYVRPWSSGKYDIWGCKHNEINGDELQQNYISLNNCLYFEGKFDNAPVCCCNCKNEENKVQVGQEEATRYINDKMADGYMIKYY